MFNIPKKKEDLPDHFCTRMFPNKPVYFWIMFRLRCLLDKLVVIDVEQIQRGYLYYVFPYFVRIIYDIWQANFLAG